MMGSPIGFQSLSNKRLACLVMSRFAGAPKTIQSNINSLAHVFKI